MIRRFLSAAAALVLAACATQVPPPERTTTGTVEVQILALNDFHGNLEPSVDPVRFAMGPGNFATAPSAGGAAVVGHQLAVLRSGHKHSITVAAGDLVGASPLISAYFLDEPTIDAMNLMGLSLASVGNHEFDKGSAELLRMQNGGCAKFTTRVPCRLEPFTGARFRYLAANVVRADGSTLFPATELRRFGPITIGFIGMTLKETGTLVTPTGVAGLHFADEAETANSLVPKLKAAGADAIVLLIHQGGRVPRTYQLQDCDGLDGEILPILDRLDPAIATIISGHTHQAYACKLERGGAKRLLTSAGKYGYLVSNLTLTFNPSTHRLIDQDARNVPMIRSGGGDPKIASLVGRYVAATAPAEARVVGRLPGPLPASAAERESPAADLIADAQLAATLDAAHGDADLSFINSGGVRTGLIPAADGSVTYGQIFAMEPFGNSLVVKPLSGAQLKALLEEQFEDRPAGAMLRPSVLIPSANFAFAYDLSRPAGDHITAMALGGQPIDPAKTYRVTINNFLASGGDGYSVLARVTEAFDAGLDLDALEAWLATNPAVPSGGRVRDVTPTA